MRSTIGAAVRVPLESSEDMEEASSAPIAVSRSGRQAVKPPGQSPSGILPKSPRMLDDKRRLTTKTWCPELGSCRPSTERSRAYQARDLAELSWHTQCC